MLRNFNLDFYIKLFEKCVESTVAKSNIQSITARSANIQIALISQVAALIR